MVGDAVLPDTAFYMLEEFAGRMANAGNPRKDQVIWNIYSDTLTYKDFEHMSYDREGNEARVSTTFYNNISQSIHVIYVIN